jgi:hypothetical protein
VTPHLNLRRFLWALPFCIGSQLGAEVTSNPCDLAASEAAQHTGVPIAVLRAVTLAETGQSLQGAFLPWPWTIHSQGRGRWFHDANSALIAVESLMSAGEQNIDIGCFQINYRWHSDQFDTIQQMIDPAENALYAAHFLQKLFKETGNWRAAAGAYHSQNSTRSETYLRRLETLYETYLRQPERPNPTPSLPTTSARFTLPKASAPLITRHAQPLLATGRLK